MNTRSISSLPTYVSIQDIFHVFKEEEGAVFLDSSLRNELGRYSIIALYPYLSLVKGKTFTINGQICEEPFEDYLRRYLEENKEPNPTKLPIVSGGVGYFSYDYGRNLEKIPTRHTPAAEIPDCILNFYDVFLIEDHQADEIQMVANGRTKDSSIMLKELRSRIVNEVRVPILPEVNEDTVIESDFTREDYLHAIEDMINYIVEGDIYIANMTQQLRILSPRKPYEVFRKLRKNNPSPFGGYLNYKDFQVICASPERFLKMEHGLIETRPIKGTRKRGKSKREDRELRLELQNSKKDKSELLMIVDLERNDLNKICKPGSVKVQELYKVEEYATVFHLAASITGELREQMNVVDLIQAAFPGGSITGAPKHRAMEIIDELEHDSRGLYTGSIGYLSLDGCCDFNIVIRTALHQKGYYYLGVGGGITSESELDSEYEETLQKAKAILEALR